MGERICVGNHHSVRQHARETILQVHSLSSLFFLFVPSFSISFISFFNFNIFSWHKGRANNDFKLGSVQFVNVNQHITIANILAQQGLAKVVYYFLFSSSLLLYSIIYVMSNIIYREGRQDHQKFVYNTRRYKKD